jgi:hypothetical protein
LEVFNDWGCQELVEVIKLPTGTAKRISPLDNVLIHIWKQKVLQSGPLTKKHIRTKMSDAWNQISSREIHQQYKKSGVIRGTNLSFVCPNPVVYKQNI